MVPPDPQTGVSETCYAVVYAPGRSARRNRFAQSCVSIQPNREAALANADHGKNRFAAKVLGPSKSSEGQYLYYLLEWIES